MIHACPGLFVECLRRLFASVEVLKNRDQTGDDQDRLDLTDVDQCETSAGVLDGGHGGNKHPQPDRIHPVDFGQVNQDFLFVLIDVLIDATVEHRRFIAAHDLAGNLKDDNIAFKQIIKFHRLIPNFDVQLLTNDRAGSAQYYYLKKIISCRVRPGIAGTI